MIGAPTRTLEDYARSLRRLGMRVVPGQSGTLWVSYQGGTMMRRPTFTVGPASADEVRVALRGGRALLASYLVEPDAAHPANAWLYLCTDQQYALESLSPAMRRNVRRGLSTLTIAPLTLEKLLAHGETAYCDTRRRVGLRDGTPEIFRQRFMAYAGMPEQVFLGAWKDSTLAAFLTITEVEDWAELGCFSADALLAYRPNDTLMFRALSHYLVERRFRAVSYGLSSIHAERNAAGLHRFKLKVGFEALPVRRAFVPHPLLRPLANRVTLWGVQAAQRLRPHDHRLRLAGGTLAYILGTTHMMEVAAGAE
jgi:hypothetical protein